MSHEQPPLPYPLGELEGFMSEEQMEVQSYLNR